MINRDTKMEIVIKMPMRFKVIAWLCLLGFATIFVSGLWAILGGEGGGGYWMTFIGFPWVLVGIWMVGMTTKVTFNQPQGYMTITRSHMPLFLWFWRTRIISREEANSAFVACRAKQTLIDQIVTLLGVFITLVPTNPHLIISYEVRIVTASGKEIQLYKSRKAEVVDYLAKRMVGFAEGTASDKIFIEEQDANGQKAQMKRVSLPKNAGVLEIICGPLVFFTLLYTYYGFGYEGYYELAEGSWLLILISIMAIIAILPIVGGIYALRRKKWWLALAGSIVSLIFLLLGILAFIFILYSKDEFE